MGLFHLPGILVLTLAGVTMLGYINIHFYLEREYIRLTTECPHDRSEFDFIVVGSGSAGSVVAARVAEAGHSVLLLEAGGPSNPLQGVPSMTNFFRNSPYDYGYTSQKLRTGTGGILKGGLMPVPRGRSLGGSSMLNWMAYIRGHRGDYNEWAALKNPGWSYQDVFPHFRKSQAFVGNVSNEHYHGHDGPLGVMQTRYIHPVNEILIDTFEEMGYPIGDVNAEEAEDTGFFPKFQAQVFQENSVRRGTYKSFVEPILGKKKITVVTFATVTKILFSQRKVTKAIGVEFERFGKKYTYLNKKEIAVCAGAVGSPQLLMVSGIGPKDHLSDLGIDVVADLPVGGNLMDHLTVPYHYSTYSRSLTLDVFGVVNPYYWYQYLVHGGGPHADNGVGTVGFIHTPANKEVKRPDIQIHTVPFGIEHDYGVGLADSLGVDTEKVMKLKQKYLDRYSFTILPSLLRPKSRGTIRLASKNIHDAPIIDFNYLSHQRDVDTLVEGMKFAHNLIQTETFKKHGFQPHDPDDLMCGDYEPYSDPYWECYVKNWAGTLFHASGTCKMGPDTDLEAVVDHRLNVKGVSNLRVIDASIMPKVVGGNTNAATIMIGEKGAEMLLSNWRTEESVKAWKEKKKAKEQQEQKQRKQEL